MNRWIDGLLAEFEGSILPFDLDVAHLWGHLLARSEQNPIDKQLAATAILYGLTVVTRNVRHVKDTGAAVLDPFAD